MHFSQSTDPVVGVMAEMDSLVNSVVPSNTPEHETQFPHTVVPDIYNDGHTSPISFGSDSNVDLFPYFEDKLKPGILGSGPIKSGIDIALVSDAHMSELFESFDRCSPSSNSSSCVDVSPTSQSQQPTQSSSSSSIKEPSTRSSAMCSSNNSGGGSRRSEDPGRNARMAKENRERKKKYVQGLENKVRDLEADQSTASSRIADLETKLEKANAEIVYLQDMLKNQSSIAKVIASVVGMGSIKFAEPSGDAPAIAQSSSDAQKTKRRLNNQQSASSSAPMQTRKRNKRACPDQEEPKAAARPQSTVIPVQFNIHVNSS